MNWKNLFWIVPLTFLLAFLFGFASKVYIEIPPKVTIEMGYTEATLDVIANKCNMTLPIDTPEPETLYIKPEASIRKVTEIIPRID